MQNLSDLQITDSDFSFISEIVRKQTGIVIREGKMAMVRGRLARRVRTLNLGSISQYCALLKADHNELQGLINAITTNHTSFFRERHHFDFLETHVFPGLIEKKEKRIRIWSAACSSGEEPYCIAAVAAKFQNALGSTDFKILATDIDTDMIAKAERGVYPNEAIANTPKDLVELLDPIRQGNTWTVPKKLKDMIAFRDLNLLEEWPFSGLFDVVFCRNVMIYFDSETKAELIDRFSAQIKLGGYLCIGHSESLPGQSKNLTLMGRTIYRKT